MISLMNPTERPVLSAHEPIRAVNLRTDLAQLADLIELVFADSMDYGGRAAIREMRAMSHMGVGLSVLSRLNELAMGINLGFVWIESGQVVGNVSVFPADWHASLGRAWIIANVAVHPDFRRRGIARRLMERSLHMVRERGGDYAILQVNYDNERAIDLYESLGFVRERAFTTWTRDSGSSLPRFEAIDDVFITRRRESEWQSEYALVAALRPFELGGIGWMKPTHESLFHVGFLGRLVQWLSMSSTERLIVRAEDGGIRTSLWLEHGVGSLRVTMYLFADEAGLEEDAPALLQNALRRFRTANIMLEHPADDAGVNALLRRYYFRAHRTVWHMRLTL